MRQTFKFEKADGSAATYSPLSEFHSKKTEMTWRLKSNDFRFVLQGSL